jgi:hypothetical protein
MTDRAPTTLDQLEREMHEHGFVVSVELAVRLLAEARRLEHITEALLTPCVGCGGKMLYLCGDCVNKELERLRAALTEAQQERERLAQAAQTLLNCEIFVGVTDEQKRAAYQRLGSLAAPYLPIARAATAPPEETPR